MYDFLDKIGLKAVLEAIKGKIPKSLPANGGNADYATNADKLDGYHASDFAKSTNPIINGDMIFERDSSQQTVSAVYSVSDMLILRNANKDNLSSRCDVMISVDGVRIVTDTQNFKIGDGGNADTVDGKHANDFIYPRAYLNNVDLNTILYPCSALAMADCTNTPTTNSWGTLLCYSGGTGSHVQLWVTAADSSMFKRHYDGAKWSEWDEISTTPIKSVVIGGTTDAYGNFTIWKASDGKIPIYAKIFGYYVFPFLSVNANEYYYYLGICQTASHEWVADTAVSGTVYYIEI